MRKETLREIELLRKRTLEEVDAMKQAAREEMTGFKKNAAVYPDEYPVKDIASKGEQKKTPEMQGTPSVSDRIEYLYAQDRLFEGAEPGVQRGQC